MTDGGDRSPAHPPEQELAAFLDGTLAPPDVAAVEQHLDGCAECRRLMLESISVLASPRAAATVRAEPRGRRAAEAALATTAPRPWLRRRLPAIVASAAALGAILVARQRPLAPVRPDQLVRTPASSSPSGEGLAVLTVHTPAAGESLEAKGARFTWAASAAERYRFVLADAEGKPRFTEDTRDTSLTLPDSVALQAGALYFWHADAVGGGVTATTRLQRFTVSR